MGYKDDILLYKFFIQSIRCTCCKHPVINAFITLSYTSKPFTFVIVYVHGYVKKELLLLFISLLHASSYVTRLLYKFGC